MNRPTKRFLAAMGSILDLSPATNYKDYIIQQPNDAIAENWRQVGNYMRSAMRELDVTIAQKATMK